MAWVLDDKGNRVWVMPEPQAPTPTSQGYQYDPDEEYTFVVPSMRDGQVENVDIVRVRGSEAARLGPNARLASPEEIQAVAQVQRQNERQAELAEQGPVAGATAFLDAVLPREMLYLFPPAAGALIGERIGSEISGAPAPINTWVEENIPQGLGSGLYTASAAATRLAEGQPVEGIVAEADRQIAERANANPGWTTAGTVGGLIAPLLVPGGQALAAGRGATGVVRSAAVASETRSLAQILRSMTPGGISATIAEMSVPRLQALAARTGHPRLAQIFARGSEGAIDGVISGLMHAQVEANLRNQPLAAEQLIADAGLGALFGFGLGSLGGALMREGAPAALSHASEVAERELRDNPTIARAIANVSGADPEMLSEYYRLREYLTPSNTARIDRSVQRMGTTLDDGLRTQGNVIERLINSEPTERQFYGFFETDVTAARHARDVAINSALNDAQRAIDTKQVSNIGAARARSVIREANSILRNAPGDAQSSFADIARFRDYVRDVPRRSGSRTDTVLSSIQSQLTETLTGVNSVFGDAGIAQTKIDNAFSKLSESRQALLDALGVKTAGGEVRVSAAKILSGLDDAKSGASVNLFDDLTRYADSLEESLEALADVPSVTDAEIRSLADTAQALRRELDEVRPMFRARELKRALESSSPLPSLGALAHFAGPVAGAVGSFVGGPAGGAVGYALGGAASAIYSAARNVDIIERIARVEETFKRFGMATERGLDNLRKSIDIAAKRGMRAVPNLVKGTTRAYTAKQLNDDYKKLRSQVLDMQANQDALLDRVQVASAVTDTLDPAISQEIAILSTNILGFLSSQMPAGSTDPLLPNRDALPPSRTAMDRFVRQVRMVENPLSIYDKFAQGTLSKDEADTVRTVYPNLYNEVAANVMAVLADAAVRLEARGEELPYAYRLQASQLFGGPTDPTLDPSFVASMQNLGAQTTQQSMATGDAGRPRTSSRTPTFPEMDMTAYQAAEARGHQDY